MTVRTVALALGIAYALAGLLGLVPGALTPPMAGGEPMFVETLHGELFGLFAVNLPHTLVHIAIGAWGLLAWSRPRRARIFLRSIAVLYGALAIFGLLPGFNTMFGLLPLHGHDVWLHAATALVAGYAGFRLADRPAATTAPAHDATQVASGRTRGVDSPPVMERPKRRAGSAR